MHTLDDWLAEYAESHRHPLNKTLHWICVPAIVLAVLGALRALPAPATLQPFGGWAAVAAVLALGYWTRLSWRLALGMLPLLAALGYALHALDAAGPPPWLSCLVIFVVAWIGQFVGHRIEGRKPSFLKDVVFLLIGPAWLMSRLYKKLGQRY